MKIYFNTKIYDKIKLDLDYQQVYQMDAADIIITGTEPVFLTMYSPTKYVICPCTNTDHVKVYNKAKVISLKGLDILQESHSTVEHTVFMILYLLKRNSLLYSKREKFSDNLSNKSVGIVGYGRVGKRVADTLRAMGCDKVSFCDTKYPKIYENNFKYLIKNSDIISLHTSVTPDQKPIITEEVIKKMKKRCYLINTSRGSVIDERALLRNISKFSGVALDVLQNDTDSPYKQRLMKHSHVLITSHYGGYTRYDVERTYLACIDKLKEELG